MVWISLRRAALTVACVLAPVLAAQAQERQPLVVAVIGGQLGTKLRALYEPWEEKNNAKIRWVANASSAETVAKLVAQKAKPEFDIAFGDNLTHYSGSKQGLWAPLDPAVVTSLKDLSPAGIPSTPGGVGVGFFYGGLFYRSDEFQKNGWAPPVSWQDIYRPELCGRVGIQVPTSTYTMHMLIMLAGGDPAKVPAAIEKLGANRKCIPVMEPVNKLEEKMQLGEYVIGVHGQIRAVPMMKSGQPVRFVRPSEGAVVSYVTMSLVANGPNPALAQKFFDWALTPDSQKQLMEEAAFGPVNTKVPVPAELQAEGIPDAATVAKMVSGIDEVVFEQRRDWGRLLERAMAR